MRWLVFLIALGGAAGSGFLGYKYMSDLSENKDLLDAIRKAKPAGEFKPEITFDLNDKYRVTTRMLWSYIFLLAGAGLGFIGGLYALARRKFAAFLILVLAGA